MMRGRKGGRTLFFLLLLGACAPRTDVVCTMEAKQCPDGSYVGRDPANNCSFKPCPGK